MNKTKLVQFLDEYLELEQFEDSSKNGLQVDNSKNEIQKI
jgi:putative NIF3 family GTP cyclohydrolase 1 type 2